MFAPTPVQDPAVDGFALLALAAAIAGAWGLFRSVSAAPESDRRLARWHAIAAAVVAAGAVASYVHCTRAQAAHPGPPLRTAALLAGVAAAHGICRALTGVSWSWGGGYGPGRARLLAEVLAWTGTLVGLILVTQC